MIRRINGASFGNGAAEVRIIETRDDAAGSESFFFQLTNLYQQLTDRKPARNLAQLVGNNLHFIFITEATNLVGSATLAVVKTAIRCRGHIEDVVIDQRYRKCGLGRLLIQECIQLAQRRGCQCLQLTSKPDRSGTACFYPQLGFELVAVARSEHPEGTHLYRYEF